MCGAGTKTAPEPAKFELILAHLNEAEPLVKPTGRVRFEHAQARDRAGGIGIDEKLLDQGAANAFPDVPG